MYAGAHCGSRKPESPPRADIPASPIRLPKALGALRGSVSVELLPMCAFDVLVHEGHKESAESGEPARVLERDVRAIAAADGDMTTTSVMVMRNDTIPPGMARRLSDRLGQRNGQTSSTDSSVFSYAFPHDRHAVRPSASNGRRLPHMHIQPRIRPGFPRTSAKSGTSRTTTAPAPTNA